MIGSEVAWSVLHHIRLLPSKKVISSSILLQYAPAAPWKAADWRGAFLYSTLFCFLLSVFCQDVFTLVSPETWTQYIGKGNRVINIFREIKPVVLDLKNCSTMLLFAMRSEAIKGFICDVRIFITRLDFSDRRKARHEMTFFLCFYVAFGLGATRLSIGIIAYLITLKDPFMLYGIWKIPLYANLCIDGMANLVGDLLTLCVYVQLASFANLLTQCCENINTKISSMKSLLRIDDSFELTLTTTRVKILKLREFFETFVQLYKTYERLFSSLIAFGLVNHFFALFGSAAALFQSGRPDYFYICQGLAFATYLFIILMIAYFPVYLYEETLRTREVLQDMVYRYQAIRRIDMTLVEGQNQPWEADVFVLYGFLQRTMTKPYVVTAGGFVEMKRRFFISLVAILVTFAIFLIQQYDGRRPRPCVFKNETGALIPI